jgi:hypothetical protein
MWTCPECGRKFTRNNQSHSCIQYNLDDLLIGKDPGQVALFRELMERISIFGEMELHAGKWGITVRHLSTFLSIIIEKNHLTLVFLSGHAIDEFPVYQNYHHSTHKWSNAVKIENSEEIDDQLIGWLKEAWELAV